MAFGKRLKPPQRAGDDIGVGFTTPVPTQEAVDRAAGLCDQVHAILGATASIAFQIKAGGAVSEQGYDAGSDPQNHPLPIGGFARHFNFVRDGLPSHGVYAFAGTDGAVDVGAQLVFLEMATAATRLNALCWEAQPDGGLSMALQSEAAREEIDRIIVTAGFLGVMLETLIESRGGGVTARSIKDHLKLWADRARDLMIEPNDFDRYYPNVPWPVTITEVEVKDHQGQLVVNSVYLPETLATPVRTAMMLEQMQATG